MKSFLLITSYFLLLCSCHQRSKDNSQEAVDTFLLSTPHRPHPSIDSIAALIVDSTHGMLIGQSRNPDFVYYSNRYAKGDDRENLDITNDETHVIEIRSDSLFIDRVFKYHVESAGGMGTYDPMTGEQSYNKGWHIKKVRDEYSFVHAYMVEGKIISVWIYRNWKPEMYYSSENEGKFENW